jgi:site-specific recombinase XerD
MTYSDFPSTLDLLVEAFVDHQRRTRGLRDRTLQGYVSIVRPMIRDSLGEDPIAVRDLGPHHVVEFVHTMSGRYSARSMKNVRTALRSLFRFLRGKGVCDQRLELSIPAMPSWRRTTLPRGLGEEQVRSLLASFESSTPCGRRDRAIVECLARLGLRPGEVATLRLDDIDWREGVVRIRTRKTGRGAVLPLPRGVGRVIVDYLRHERPSSEQRELFLQHTGCRRGAPVSSGVISMVVYRGLRRAGIEAPIAGAYVLRHSVAIQMVRSGISLKEVADFLGHRSLDTTTIYAKLDVVALREVALPWPEVSS